MTKNIINILTEQNVLCEVESIEGLNIIFKGENSIITVENSPQISFRNVTMTLGSNAFVYIASSKFVFHNSNLLMDAPNASIKIGKNFSCGGLSLYNRVESDLEVKIGDDVLVATQVYFRVSDGHSIYDMHSEKVLNYGGDIVIGNHVWISEYAKILKGVHIPNNTIIANSALVTKSFFEENTIIAGVPAKIIRTGVNWKHSPPA